MEKEGLEVSLEAEPTKTEEIKMTTLEPEPEETELLKRSGTPVTEQPGPSSGGYVGKFVSLPFSPSLSVSVFLSVSLSLSSCSDSKHISIRDISFESSYLHEFFPV